MTQGSNSIADDLLRNGFERWQRLEGEKQAISDDLKELFQELKGNGFDGKALRAAFRKVAKIGDTDVQDLNAVVDLYVDSLTAPRVGTVPATHTRAAREVKPDPIAALKADPAMSIVDVANLKKSEPQPTKAAEQQHDDHVASDLASAPQGQVAPHSDIGNPISNDIDGQPSAAAEVTTPDANTHGQTGTADQRARSQVPANAEAVAKKVGQSEQEAALEPPVVTPVYAAPGVITWESSPPEGVERHDYSRIFGTIGQDIAVIEDDLAGAKAQPIVKIGRVVLDGWARFMQARGMYTDELRDGVAVSIPLEYPVVQYDGTDPLIDCIKWNVEGRLMTSEQKFRVAQALAKFEPKRKADIYAAFEMGMELVGA